MIDEKDQLISNLENEVRRLRDENKKLEETVQWMHDLTDGQRKRRTKGWGDLQPDSRKACGDPCMIKRPSGAAPEVSFLRHRLFKNAVHPIPIGLHKKRHSWLSVLVGFQIGLKKSQRRSRDRQVL